jgi:hypothetical protein
MQLSLRPYVTTGVALVGASVIAAAPITPIAPTDVSIPNPTVTREVQLAGLVDDTVNQLLFAVIASPTVRITNALLVPLAEALGVDPVLASSLPVLSLGLVGPLISGGGATGVALQGIVDAIGNFDLAELINASLISGPATIVTGLTLGGFGPNLVSLVSPDPLPPAFPLPSPPFPPMSGAPLTGVFAGGLIPNPGVLYPAQLGGLLGLTITPTGSMTPPFATASVLLPSFFTSLQALSEAVSGLLNEPETMSAKTAGTNNVATLTSDNKVEAPAPRGPIRELLGNVRDAVAPNSADGPEVLPKKNRPLLNILKLNPLDQSANKDKKDNVSSLNSNDNTPGKHRIGTPVRDLIHKVLGGGHDKDDNDEGTGGESTDDAPK